MISTVLQTLLHLNNLTTLIQQNIGNSLLLILNAVNECSTQGHSIKLKENILNYSTNSGKTKKSFNRKKNCSFSCKYQDCSKKYTTKENLNLHISNIHFNIRPYNCNFCHKIFSHRNGKKFFI